MLYYPLKHLVIMFLLTHKQPFPILFLPESESRSLKYFCLEKGELPMLKELFIALTILVTTTSVSFAGSELNMQEGKWEITTKMEIPAMPMDMPPMKHTQCLTKKDLLPQSSQGGQECKISQTKISGDTVTWAMQCSGGHGGDSKGNGTIAYNGSSMKGTIKMTNTQSNTEVTSHLTGNRIGDCN